MVEVIRKGRGMKKPSWTPSSFSVRLILAFFVLILLTTVSAGIPAYLLTRSALRDQAWSQVEGGRRATESLLSAEEERLASLVTLFSERPTLQRLVREGAAAELQNYLAAFQAQTELDLLLVCDAAGERLAVQGRPESCAGAPEPSFRLLDGRPVLVAGDEIIDDTSGERLGSAWGGIWLDEGFLVQMELRTGLAQSILGPGGERLASTVPGLSVAGGTGGGRVQRYELEAGGEPYYAASFPLAEGSGLLAEAALPVAGLASTETNALLILAGSTAVVAILGGLSGILIVRQLGLPLQQLTGVAERIGAGELVTPIPLVSGPAEVSTLAAALQRSQASMLEALRERSEALEWRDTLIQSIVEGVVTVDSRGCITFLSQGAEALSGWAAEDAVGQPLDTVFPLDAEEGGSMAQLPAPGEKRQIAVRTRQGKKVVLAVTGAELAPPAGEETQMALVLRDVTQEDAVRHLRSYFLANISHEFLTPLSTLNASMELLLDPAEPLSAAEMRELLKPTYLSLRGLQTLIDNLLESSSIEAGRFSLRRQPVDLNAVLAQALQLVEPLLERRQQPVSVGQPGSLPVIYGDPARLTQVLVNLLANASKYSPAQKPIDVRVEQRGAALRISVADQGPGIPEAERADVFRGFVRGEMADSEQYGIGLGLYVVKTAVAAHGGHVGIDDRPGGGSIVWFELPLQEGNNGA